MTDKHCHSKRTNTLKYVFYITFMKLKIIKLVRFSLSILSKSIINQLQGKHYIVITRFKLYLGIRIFHR